MTKKKDEFTVAKVMSAVMVVYIHMYLYDNSAGPMWINVIMDPLKTIINVCVPMFFTISAYLLFSKDFDWATNFKKKIKSLFIPYMFWNVIWLFVTSIVDYAVFHKVFMIKDLPLKLFGTPFGGVPVCVPFWYIRDLFLLNLIAPVFSFLAKKLPIVSSILCFALWMSPLDSHLRRSVVFFFFGCLVANYPVIIDKIKSMNPIIASVLAVFSLGLTYLDNEYVQKFVILPLLVLFIYLVCKLVKLPNVVNVCNKMYPYVFIIYAVHYYLCVYISMVVCHFFSFPPFIMALLSILLPIFVIFICIIFAKVYKKLMPRLCSFSTSGR